jgi:hypothetical protein
MTTKTRISRRLTVAFAATVLSASMAACSASADERGNAPGLAEATNTPPCSLLSGWERSYCQVDR